MSFRDFCIFTLGVTVGSIVTVYYLNKKKENDILEETEYNDYQKTSHGNKPQYKVDEKPDLETIIINTEEREKDIKITNNTTMDEIKNDILEKINTNIKQAIDSSQEVMEKVENYCDNDVMTMANVISEKDKPYILDTDVDEPINNEEYDMQTLTYYPNSDILIDSAYGEEFTEGFDSKVIGSDILNTIKHGEDDVYYVRNDRLKMDYEILISDEEYNENDYSFYDDEYEDYEDE